jgi:hypothetical protein
MDGTRVNLPFQIAIHDREENLQEQINGIDQHSQQVQPCLAGHHDSRLVARACALSFPIFLCFFLSLLPQCYFAQYPTLTEREVWSSEKKDFPKGLGALLRVTRPWLQRGNRAWLLRGGGDGAASVSRSYRSYSGSGERSDEGGAQ